jgi:hypothetical protein
VTINTKAAAPTRQANVQLLGAMRDRLRGVRGITAVSYARRPVQTGWSNERLIGADGRPLIAERNEVGSGYFRMLGVTPIAGHDVDTRDADRDAIPIVINQRLATALFSGQPPVGRMLPLNAYPKPMMVVGVVPNGWYSGHRRQSDPNFVFVSAENAPQAEYRRLDVGAPDETTLYVRYSGLLDEIVPAVTRTLRAVDDRAPVVYLRTMTEQLESLTWPIEALTLLLALFAGGSLLIATIGQYAAMAFTMRRRIREFGIRIALGASSRDVVASVVREGFRLTAAGLGIGCALGLGTASGLRFALFGVTPTDAPTYLAVVALLGAASLIACYVPAHRAARMDPMQALRDE